MTRLPTKWPLCGEIISDLMHLGVVHDTFTHKMTVMHTWHVHPQEDRLVAKKHRITYIWVPSMTRSPSRGSSCGEKTSDYIGLGAVHDTFNHTKTVLWRKNIGFGSTWVSTMVIGTLNWAPVVLIVNKLTVIRSIMIYKQDYVCCLRQDRHFGHGRIWKLEW